MVRAIDFCDHYLINLWSSISVLTPGNWRSLWPSVCNLMLWYPPFSISLLIPLGEDSHDLMLVRQHRLKLKYLLTSCGTDTSKAGFSTIYGRSIWFLNGKGLRYRSHQPCQSATQRENKHNKKYYKKPSRALLWMSKLSQSPWYRSEQATNWKVSGVTQKLPALGFWGETSKSDPSTGMNTSQTSNIPSTRLQLSSTFTSRT